MKKQIRLFLLFLLPLGLFSQTMVQVSVWNGSTSTFAKPEKLEVIELSEQGMNPLKTLEEPKEQYQILLEKKSPTLIRVHYKNESYVELINSEDLKKNFISKRIIVYDTTDNLSNLIVHTGMQVTKYKENLEINMIYAIQNKSRPPKTIRAELLQFALPENAKIIQASLSNENSPMPLRVNLIKNQDYYSIDKNIKPGNSELIIQIEIPNYILKKKVDPILSRINNDSKIVSVFMWRPQDLKPTIQGGVIEEKSVPNLGSANFVYYEEPEILLDFSKGSFLYKNPLKAYSNPIFDTRTKTVIGIALGLFLIFLLIPIIHTSGIRITKNA
jgi:hypothetical protein